MEKTEEMIKYEKETGKQAIWRGVITKDFKRWQKGEKIYGNDKERINILISKKRKNIWQEFATENSINTLSKLIREAVDFYISVKSDVVKLEKFTKLSHDFKEDLNTIKGFSQILIENYKDDLSWDVLLKVKEIYDKSVNIEKRMSDVLSTPKQKKINYDILIIDDDKSTLHLLSEFFKKKGITYQEASLGIEAFDYLKEFKPKLILLDILLPDYDGYEFCKKIKLDKELKDILVFYITAVPEIEVSEKMKETGADGYFLKPFNMMEFNTLLNYL